jgi:hypothetical protein
VSTVKKSKASMAAACARRNWAQVGPDRLGVGSTPCRERNGPHARGAKPDADRRQLPMNAPISPGRVVLCQSRTRCTVPTGNAGRPERRCGNVHRRRTRSRCQRRRVSGWTKKRPGRTNDSSRLQPASTARSGGRSAGRETWRRNTETSCRSITTSMARSSCLPQESHTSWSRRTKPT